MELQKAFDEGFIAVKDYLDRSLKVFEDKLKEVERGHTMKYLGTWDHQRWYEKGNFVTQDGSLWHCNEKTQTKPGSGADWTLAVKRGRDAR